MLISGVGLFNYSNLDNENNFEYAETNYIALVKLGLAPSTYQREITEYDIDTGIILSFSEGEQYSLISSRTFSTGDYGRTFLRRVA